MTEAITFLIGLILGYGIASVIFAEKKFVIKVNEKTGKVEIEPLNKPKQKVEFIGEPTREEVEEAERPTKLQSFLSEFKKPASKEEEEEV